MYYLQFAYLDVLHAGVYVCVGWLMPQTSVVDASDGHKLIMGDF